MGLEPFIYRQKCLNDLVVVTELTFKQRHIGSFDQDIITAIFASRTLELLREALDAVDKLEKLREVQIPNMAQEIEKIKRDYGLTKRDAEGIAFFTAEEAEGEPINAFHLVNGITRLARIQKDVDERIWLEELAGKMLVRYA